MRVVYRALNVGLHHGMTLAIFLLIVTVAILSFLWRNWDTITLRMNDNVERKFKIVVGMVLGMCFLGIIVCSALGLYSY